MPSRPLNVLFVCTANVCRSPLAAGLLAFHASNRGVSVNVASGSLDHEVRDVHPTTVRMLTERGVSLGRDRSQPLSEALVAGADLVLVMTVDHAKGVVGRFPAARTKTFLLNHLTTVLAPAGANESVDQWLSAVRSTPRDYSRDETWDIADPWKQSDELYVEVEAEIDRAISWLADIVSTLN